MRRTVSELLVSTVSAAVVLVVPTLATAQINEYYHLDAVGNVRVVTDQSGNVIERHDYLPFGEECTTGPCAGNPPGTNTKKFTGKERDQETGFDYFGARYYGSRIGRFTTADPVMNIQKALIDPQHWNRYSYVQNRPLSFIDPDGRESMAYTYGNVQISAVTGERIIVAPVSAKQAIAEGAAVGLLQAGLVLGPAVAPIVVTTLANPRTQDLAQEALDSFSEGPSARLPSRPTEGYDRLKHYGRTPTKADRRAIGAAADEVADHNPSLVKRYYEGDPSCCEKPGFQMTPAERHASGTDRSRMKRQSRTESNQQGAEMSRYSQEKKRELNKQ